MSIEIFKYGMRWMVFGIFFCFSSQFFYFILFLMMKLMLNKQLFSRPIALKLIQVMVNIKQQKLSIAINSSQHVQNLIFCFISNISVLMLVLGFLLFLRLSPSLICLYLSIVCDYIIISNAVIATSL